MNRLTSSAKSEVYQRQQKLRRRRWVLLCSERRSSSSRQLFVFFVSKRGLLKGRLSIPTIFAVLHVLFQYSPSLANF